MQVAKSNKQFTHNTFQVVPVEFSMNLKVEKDFAIIDHFAELQQSGTEI